MVRTLCVAVMIVLTACGRTRVTTSGDLSGGGGSPSPRHIVVIDFASDPEDVVLDRGVIPKAQQAMSPRTRTEQEREVGRKLSWKMSEELVEELRARGLGARRSVEPREEVSPGSLVVTGQFLSIDQGNQTARVVIGLGAGRSRVLAAVQIYQANPEGLAPIERLVGDARSGFKPGVAETMGVGLGVAGASVAGAAATGGSVAAGSETFLAGADADVRRMAKELAKQIEGIYAKRGWAKEVSGRP